MWMYELWLQLCMESRAQATFFSRFREKKEKKKKSPIAVKAK